MNKKISMLAILMLLPPIIAIIIFFSYRKITAALQFQQNIYRQANNQMVVDPPALTELEHFSFAVLGDTQRFEPDDHDGDLQLAVKSLEKLNPDFVVSVGDQISSCDDHECPKKIRHWKKILGPKLLPKTFVTIGNHDYHDSDSLKYWQNALMMPQNGPQGYKESVYSFDYGNARFIVLNSSHPVDNQISQIQLDWLKQDLKINQKTHTFVFFHAPAFPTGSKITESLDRYPDQRDELWAILDHYSVTAIFSGHEHLHSRSLIDSKTYPQAQNQILQFIVGNTDAFDHKKPKTEKIKQNNIQYAYRDNNFLIVQIQANQIRVKNYSVEGRLQDQYTYQFHS
ncbi:MAG: hypothetical protein GF332_04325 [Candidatus Moranbacteria bacterium]|nr:hypothetical protein [Candidatus Moranbacteria bacterium]